MINPSDAGIPEEILNSEQKQAAPVQSDAPSTLGLPGLPPAILDLALAYGPKLVLAAAVFSGLGAVGTFIGLSGSASTSSTGNLHFGASLSLVAAIFMGLSFVWLTQKRRVGWNTLAMGLMIQFLAQLLTAGVGSILYAGVEILITAYVMLQLRDHYSS